MKYRSVLEVDLGLLKKNCQTLQKMAGDSFFCPMVKAEAYGHGVGSVVQALSSLNVSQVGVISASEAWAVREAVESIDILIFGPVLNKEDLSWIVDQKMILVVSCWEDLKALAQLKKSVRIHLKFDTGFSRLGFSVKEGEQVFDFLKDHPQMKLEGLATQLVAGEELGDSNSFSFQQITKLQSLKKVFSCDNLHFLNSSALTAIHVNGLNIKAGVRPGISLYGLKTPVLFGTEPAEKKWKNLALSPVSSLKSSVVAFHKIPKGRPCSYGGVWKAPRDSQVAVVSLGYGDGFFRALKSHRNVLFRGQKRPIIGAVCMDFFMIDVTEDNQLSLGEEVVIFGQQGSAYLSVQEQAEAVGSISYELFSRLGSRVERIYKNSEG